VDVRELMLRPQKAFRIILGPKTLRRDDVLCWDLGGQMMPTIDDDHIMMADAIR
jgi:hypothetical protein